MSLEHLPKPENLPIDWSVPDKSWMEQPVNMRAGTYSYPAKPKNLKALQLPNPREWAVTDDDWKLPDGWRFIPARLAPRVSSGLPGL